MTIIGGLNKPKILLDNLKNFLGPIKMKSEILKSTEEKHKTRAWKHLNEPIPYEMVHAVKIRLIASSANKLHDNQSRTKRNDLKIHYLDVLNNA